MSQYPAQIDTGSTLPAATDNSTPVSASIFNNSRSAIIQIETELGVKPSGTSSTLRARLDALDVTISGLGAVKLAGDLGHTNSVPYVIGIQGNPVSPTVPNLGDVFAWNGIAWMPIAPAATITTAVGGDLYGLYPAPIVVGLRSKTLDPALASVGATQDGYTLTWVNADGYWEAKPAAIGFSAGGDLSGSNVSQQVISLTGSGGAVTMPTAHLSIGLVPSTTGTIRTSNGFSLVSVGAGAQDIPLIGLATASNNIVIGSQSTGIGVIDIDAGTGGGTRFFTNSIQVYGAASGQSYWLETYALAHTKMYDAALTSIKLYQDDKLGASATGATTTIQAQNATGTTSIGGNLVLNSGTGTSASGSATLSASAIYLDGTAINIRDASHSARATIETTFGHGVFGGNGAATAIVTHVGPYTGAETALAGVWFLPQGTARTTANIAIAGNGTTGDTEINSSSVIYLGISGSNKMRLSSSTFQFGTSYVTPQYTFYSSTAAQLSFGASATASATIVYDQNAAGAGSLLSILGQQGAAGVFAGGDVLIGSGAGTGGALDGNIRFKFGSTELAGIRGDLGIGTFGGTSAAGGTNFKVHVGPMPGAGGHFQAGFSDTYGCLWALPLGSIPNYTNMIMYANSTSAFFNTPVAGGEILFIDSGSYFMARISRAAGLHFAADAGQAPSIYQDTFATTPHTFTVQAANVTTGTGSDLDLTSGTGSGSVTAGDVHLKTGGTTRLTANSTGVVTIANLGAGTVQSDASGNLTSGSLSVQNGGNAWHHLIITPFAGTTNTASGTYVVAGTFELNLSELTAANGTRAITMRCVGETTSPLMSIKLYNVTAAADVTGSTLTTTSTVPVSLVTGDLTANLSAGNAIYQVQIMMAAGGGGDRVILDMANIRVDWT